MALSLAEIENRSIVHLNVADFAVAVERVVDSRLRDRPVIIAPQGASRAMVYDMSEEAYQAGVRKGMALRRAQRLCGRGAEILPPHPDRYERAMQAFFKHTLPYSPRIEAEERTGHLFVDLTGTGRLFGPPPDVAWRIRKTVKTDLSLDPIWSVAPNKLVAKVASRVVKPVGEYIVEAGDEEAAAVAGPLIGRRPIRIPASRFPAARHLLLGQDLAHDIVPSLPVIASHVMGYLSGVVPVVDVAVVLEVDEVVRRGDPLDAGHQPRVVSLPSKILPHQQGLGRHRQPHVAVSLVWIAGAVAPGYGIQIPIHIVECFLGYFQAGHPRALQGHYHPPGYGDVAIDVRTVSPAALRALSLYAVVDGPLCRILVLLVLGHSVEFADGDRTLRMGIKAVVVRTATEK